MPSLKQILGTALVVALTALAGLVPDPYRSAVQAAIGILALHVSVATPRVAP